MRILQVSRRYAPDVIGGYEANCQRFSEEWVRRGHTVTVLTRRTNGAARHDEIGGVQVVRVLDEVAVPAGRPFVDRIYQARIARANRRSHRATRQVLASDRFDVVVFWGMHTWLVAPVLAAHQHGIPCLFDLGDYWLADSLRMYGDADRLHRLFRSRFLLGGRFDAALVDAAVVHSRYMHERYRAAGLDTAALAIIPRGIADRFVEIGARRVQDPGRQPVRILCVGRVVPDKGARLLAEAFFALEATHPGVELHFYGDEDPVYAAGLRDACRERGLLDRRIFVHGGVASERMPAIYAASDVLAFPVSWDEPSSNVLLEAMAAGLPIVATRTGSNPEFVEPERNGLLVAREDAGALAGALARLLDRPDERARMGQAGRERVQAAHRLRDVFDRTEAWLNDCSRASAATSRRTVGS